MKGLGPLMVWESETLKGRGTRCDMLTEGFNARGLHCLYQREDKFPKSPKLNMAVWTDGKRLLARFWSRSQYVETESYEVLGINKNLLERLYDKVPESDDWIPQCLRDAYDDWVTFEDW